MRYEDLSVGTLLRLNYNVKGFQPASPPYENRLVEVGTIAVFLGVTRKPWHDALGIVVDYDGDIDLIGTELDMLLIKLDGAVQRGTMTFDGIRTVSEIAESEDTFTSSAKGYRFDILNRSGPDRDSV